jgi:transcriptional regulator with XRE-family HTH domain
MENPWQQQVEALGEFIRAQRKLANLSLRELATMADVSNAYLSQIERGLHEPSVRVLRSIAQALEISSNMVFSKAGLLDPDAVPATEEAIMADTVLAPAQKDALLAVYRSYKLQQTGDQKPTE